MTYADLNLFFLALATAITLIIKGRYRCLTTPVVAIPMLILTVVFDNLIVLAGIVGYDQTKLLGINVYLVPIEDFAYTIVAVLLVPQLWKAMTKNDSK